MLKKLIKNKAVLLLFSLLGVGSGVIYYLAPPGYSATGALYIKRSVDLSSDKYFAYEGYYGQQTALSFTNTVAGLIDSMDVRKMSLDKLNVPTTSYNFQKYSFLIKTKKLGPQLLTLTTKGKTTNSAKNLWEAVADSTIATATKINANGDPALSISKVSEAPVVKPQFKPIEICLPAGFLMGLFFGVLAVSLKEYFEWK